MVNSKLKLKSILLCLLSFFLFKQDKCPSSQIEKIEKEYYLNTLCSSTQDLGDFTTIEQAIIKDACDYFDCLNTYVIKSDRLCVLPFVIDGGEVFTYEEIKKLENDLCFWGIPSGENTAFFSKEQIETLCGYFYELKRRQIFREGVLFRNPTERELSYMDGTSKDLMGIGGFMEGRFNADIRYPGRLSKQISYILFNSKLKNTPYLFESRIQTEFQKIKDFLLNSLSLDKFDLIRYWKLKLSGLNGYDFGMYFDKDKSEIVISENLLRIAFMNIQLYISSDCSPQTKKDLIACIKGKYSFFWNKLFQNIDFLLLNNMAIIYLGKQNSFCTDYNSIDQETVVQLKKMNNQVYLELFEDFCYSPIKNEDYTDFCDCKYSKEIIEIRYQNLKQLIQR